MEREISGELVVLDLETDLIHHFNQTAGFIWRRCDTTCPAGIAAEIATRYDIDEQRALDDVFKTLDMLRSVRLIE